MWNKKNILTIRKLIYAKIRLNLQKTDFFVDFCHCAVRNGGSTPRAPGEHAVQISLVRQDAFVFGLDGGESILHHLGHGQLEFAVAPARELLSMAA